MNDQAPPNRAPNDGLPELSSEQRKDFTRQLKQHAESLGFPLHGACLATDAPEWDRLRQWIDRGYAGEMHYLPDRLEAYQHPQSVLDGARSLLVLGMPYRSNTPRHASDNGGGDTGTDTGQVACYAWGSADYHDVIHERLKQLKRFVRDRFPTAAVRGVVDTAPILERQFAERAGLGWRGKNTLLLNREWGSWFFLAVLLTDLPLEPDAPFESDHCGTCRACLDACPTDAFPEPYVLDATRCISYLTIEKRGEIDTASREGLGEWLFGCDVCQDVCPWNGRTPFTDEPAFAPREDLDPVDLAALFELSDEQFRTRFRRTPLWRSKRQGVLRNAALVLGNRGGPESVPTLGRVLREDPDPVVREACGWALARIGGAEARGYLDQARQREPVDELRDKLLDYGRTCGPKPRSS